MSAQSHPAELADLSQAGCLFATAAMLSPGVRLSVGFFVRGTGLCTAMGVIVREENVAGFVVEFFDTNHAFNLFIDEVTAADEEARGRLVATMSDRMVYVID